MIIKRTSLKKGREKKEENVRRKGVTEGRERQKEGSLGCSDNNLSLGRRVTWTMRLLDDSSLTDGSLSIGTLYDLMLG